MSAVAFRKLLLIRSVETGPKERVKGLITMCSDRMRSEVAAFVKEVRFWGGASYASASEFRKFLLLYSVTEGS